MKKLNVILSAALVLTLAWAGYLIAVDSTLTWSQPAGKGTLTLSYVTLTSPTISGASMTAQSWSGTTTCAVLQVTGAATVADQALCVAPSTTKFMVQRGSSSNGVSVSFSPGFSAAPTVVVANSATSSTVPYPSSVATNGFTMNGDAALSSITWIAVGNR